MYVEHLRIPVGAGTVHVERVGRGGHPIVLLHGFGTCTFLWRRLAPSLAMAGFTSLAVDLLGHGESDRPEDASYGLAAQAEYVARALAALRVPGAVVVGQDIGALVALELAAVHPMRATGVALLSPPDPDHLPGPELRALQRSAARLALTANTLFGAQPALATLLRAGVTDPANMPDRLIARYLAPWVGTDGFGQLIQRAASVEWDDDSRARLRDVALPTLVLEPEDASLRPTVDWPQRLPRATVSVERIPGAGRLLPEDAPDAVSKALIGWLVGQRSA